MHARTQICDDIKLQRGIRSSEMQRHIVLQTGTDASEEIYVSALIREAANSSEKFVRACIYQTTRRHNPKTAIFIFTYSSPQKPQIPT